MINFIKYIFLILILNSCTDGSFNESNSKDSNFELKEKGLLLVEGSFTNSTPSNIWRYFDNNKNVIAKKSFFNGAKTEKDGSELMFFDDSRLVYFRDRFGKISSPGNDDWGKTLINYYCQGCHSNHEELIGPALYEMQSFSQANFNKKLTQNHLDNSSKAINYNFLIANDLLQIKSYIDKKLVKVN